MHKIIALEGMGGTGKTTAGLILAEKTKGIYFHLGDNNPLFPHRHTFNTKPPVIMFLYYIALFTITYFNARRLAQKQLVIQDKSIAYAMSLCAALGMSTVFYKLVPSFLLTSFEKRFYFSLPLAVRKSRTMGRKKKGGQLSINDQRSFIYDKEMSREYTTIGSENLVVMPVNNKTPEQIAALMYGRLKTIQ